MISYRYVGRSTREYSHSTVGSEKISKSGLRNLNTLLLETTSTF